MHFSQGARTGTSDRALLNRTAGTLHLEGGVKLSDSGSTLSADAVDYNLNTKEASVFGKPSVMTQPANQPSASPRPAPSRSPTPKPRRKP